MAGPQPQGPRGSQANILPVSLDAVYDWFNTSVSGLSTTGLGLFGAPAAAQAQQVPHAPQQGVAGQSYRFQSATDEPSGGWPAVAKASPDDAGRNGHGPGSQVQAYRQDRQDRRGPDPRRSRAEDGFGPGLLQPGGSASSRGRPLTYEVDKEDLLDQHVGYYFRHNPQVFTMHSFVRKRPGIYEMDGREIKVEWQYAADPGQQGFLVAVDGPLRQPFSDYMDMAEDNAEYDSCGIGSQSALHSIPKDKRVSFHDQHKMYSRLEAMKVAKEQAMVREKAADYVKDGRQIPNDLMSKYKKTLQQKLDPGGRRKAAAERERAEREHQRLEEAQQAAVVWPEEANSPTRQRPGPESPGRQWPAYQDGFPQDTPPPREKTWAPSAPWPQGPLSQSLAAPPGPQPGQNDWDRQHGLSPQHGLGHFSPVLGPGPGLSPGLGQPAQMLPLGPAAPLGSLGPQGQSLGYGTGGLGRGGLSASLPVGVGIGQPASQRPSGMPLGQMMPPGPLPCMSLPAPRALSGHQAPARPPYTFWPPQ